MSVIYFGLIASIFLFIYMLVEAHRNRVCELELTFPNFPESFGHVTIFFISDIHRRKISKRLIKKINKKPDLVIIGGDLTEKGVPFSRVSKNVALLTSLAPTYFVWGNNDYEVDFHQLDALLQEHGVKILDNTATYFESEQGEKIVLLGVDDLKEKRDRLDLALFDAGKGGFKILVCHNPKIIHKIKKEDEISLVLSGHTHGGQIRFFKFGLYEKGKLYHLPNTVLLISNGFGTTRLPLRLCAPSETHLITIKRTK
jgi:uncharacterized protein